MNFKSKNIAFALTIAAFFAPQNFFAMEESKSSTSRTSSIADFKPDYSLISSSLNNSGNAESSEAARDRLSTMKSLLASTKADLTEERKKNADNLANAKLERAKVEKYKKMVKRNMANHETELAEVASKEDRKRTLAAIKGSMIPKLKKLNLLNDAKIAELLTKYPSSDSEQDIVHTTKRLEKISSRLGEAVDLSDLPENETALNLSKKSRENLELELDILKDQSEKGKGDREAIETVDSILNPKSSAAQLMQKIKEARLTQKEFKDDSQKEDSGEALDNSNDSISDDEEGEESKSNQ